jgi:hypothetical protein
MSFCDECDELSVSINVRKSLDQLCKHTLLREYSSICGFGYVA